MLQANLRLKKRKTFNYIYKNGKTAGNKNLVVVYLPMKSKNLKIGFSVSSKVGNSVVRNRVRRVLRAAMRNFVASLSTNFNIIIVAKTGAETLEYATIVKELEILLKRAGILSSEKTA